MIGAAARPRASGVRSLVRGRDGKVAGIRALSAASTLASSSHVSGLPAPPLTSAVTSSAAASGLQAFPAWTNRCAITPTYVAQADSCPRRTQLAALLCCSRWRNIIWLFLPALLENAASFCACTLPRVSLSLCHTWHPLLCWHCPVSPSSKFSYAPFQRNQADMQQTTVAEVYFQSSAVASLSGPE